MALIIVRATLSAQVVGPHSGRHKINYLPQAPLCGPQAVARTMLKAAEIFPLTGPHCGGEMKIIAFVTETPSLRAILTHIGEPTRQPAIAPARASPWNDSPVEVDPDYDLLTQPEPDQKFDQRIQW